MLALTVLGGASVQAAEPARDLARQITEGLAQGRDVSALLARARAELPPVKAGDDRSQIAADAGRAEQALLVALNGIGKGTPSVAQTDAVLHAYTSWQAANLLMADRFDGIGERLQKAGIQGEHSSRLQTARREFDSARQPVAAAIDGCIAALGKAGSTAAGLAESGSARLCVKAFGTARELLQKRQVVAKPRILRGSLLPFHRVRATPRTLPATTSIVPAYAATQEVTPLPADSASSDLPITAAVAAKAKSLGYDYVQLYEFVRNHMRTEWYAGAQKSADTTLAQLGGNDVDQATLLIALYRSAGVPARYVQGVIERPVEELQESLGVSTPAQVTSALTQAGIAYATVTRGGRVAALRLEHTWVEVHVPYANYRGSSVDLSGKGWVALMPAVKRNSVTAPDDIWQRAGLDTASFITQYLGAPQAQTPMEQIGSRINAYLSVNQLPGDYSGHLGSSAVVAENLDLLPNSLPVSGVTVIAESAALPSALSHRVRLTLSSGSTTSLDYQAPLAELAGQRITLSYIAASVEDDRLTRLFGGLDRVPLYLIRLRPQLKVNGVVVAYGKEAMEPGVLQRLEIVSSGPVGEERAEHQVLAGALEAISIQAQQPVQVPEGTRPDDTDSEAGRLLYRAAADYAFAWMTAEQELAALRHTLVLRPSPAVVIVGNSYQPEIVQGRLQHLRWSGVAMDAVLHPVAAVARGTSDTSGEWMRLAALQGSALEQDVFNDTFLAASISADKGLALAASRGLQVHTLSGSAEAAVAALQHPDVVKDDIRQWLALGYTVTVPQATITFEDWSGSVWRVEDTATGAAGYFIAGGLAGGETALHAARWPLEWLRQALQRANLLQGSGTSPARLVRVGATDGQQGVAGELLDSPLTVRVEDIDGLPIAEAAVTFTATVGNGTFEGDADSVTVFSDAAGFAQVRFATGQETRPSIYFRVNPGDEFPQRVGINEIDAQIAGTTIASRPFRVYGLPGPVAKLVRTNPERTPYVMPLSWSDSVFLRAADQYGNPVANAYIEVAAEPLQSTCPTQPSEPRNLRFFGNADLDECLNDITRSCARDTLRLRTNSAIAAFYVVAGNVMGATYKATFKGPNNASYNSEYKTGGESGECGITPQVRHISTVSVNIGGGNAQAARVTETVEMPIEAVLYYIGSRSVEASGSPGDCTFTPSSDVEIKPIDGMASFEFSSNNGAFATGRQVSANVVEAMATTGPTPRVYPLIFKATGVQFTGPKLDPDTCTAAVQPQTVDYPKVLINEFFGVLPVITGVDQPGNSLGQPGVLVVDSEGYPEKPATLRYEIRPDYFPGHSAYAEFSNGWISYGNVGQGPGEVIVPRQVPYDPARTHKATMFASRVIKSDEFVIPTYSRLLRNVHASGRLYSEIDVVNADVCESASNISFDLSEEADVVITFIRQELDFATGQYMDGSSREYRRVRLGQGTHRFPVTAGELGTGQFRVKIEGTRVRNGAAETYEDGKFTSEETRIDILAVGRTIVQGVDVAAGTFSMSSTDFSLPGRMPLTFSRSYSGGANSHIGALGIGWGHSFDSSLHIDRCGRVRISGGAGGGMRFEPQTDGSMKPYKGYHGTLIPNHADQSFDFYSKDGTRYHYRNFGWEGIYPEWNLEYIQDTNGNTIRLAYDPRPRKTAKLTSVVDDAGRQINFHYVEKAFQVFVRGQTAPDGAHSSLYATELKEVVEAVEGPAGLRVEFQYDAYGRLIEAKRVGTPQRLETYQYAENPLLEPIPLAHAMRKYLDPRRNETVINYRVTPMTWQVRRGEEIITVTPSMGVVESVRLPSLDASAFQYDFENKRTTVSHGGASTTYTWDGYGRVTQQAGPAGTVVNTWSPDDIVLLKRHDERGYDTDYTYDAFGNVTSETRDGHTRRAFFTPRGAFQQIRDRKDWQGDRNDKRTTFDYDARGNLVLVKDAELKETDYRYYDNGDLREVENARGARTHYREYDDAGNIKLVENHLGGSVRTTYDERYRKRTVTDEDGRTTTYDYDDLDHLTKITFNDGSFRRMQHDAMGNLEWEEDELGQRTAYEYDGQNKVAFIKRNDDTTKTITYDQRGNKETETDWQNNTTTYVYNLANCMTERREPLGKKTVYVPDEHCNVKSEEDALHRITGYAYDGYNRVLEKNEPLGKHTSYRYDGENKRREIDTYNRETWFEYDAMNRLKKRIEKERWISPKEKVDRIIGYDYDEVGNLKTETDARSHVTQYGYDLLNRRNRLEDREHTVRTYEYKPSGLLWKENVFTETGTLTTRHEYDRRGRLEEKFDAEGARWSYGYYANGDLKTETWPNGNVLTHTYNDHGQRRSSVDRIGRVGEWDYDANGKITLQVDGNGNRTVLEYNALGYLDKRLEPLVTRGGSGQAIVDYEPDLMGHVTTETTDRGGFTRYEYNALYQLTDIYQRTATDQPLLHQHFEYDLLGNRTLERDRNGHEVTQQFNDLYQLVARRDAIGTQEFTYDLLGNKRSEKDRRGLVTSYSYDDENRLETVSRLGVQQWKYEYDKMGRRFRETDANGNATTYVFDGMGRVRKESRPETAVTTHAYNAQGNRTDTYLPEGQHIHYEYDLRNRQTESHRVFHAVQRPTEITKHGYDLNNNRISMERPRKNAWQYLFNEANLLWKVVSPAGATTYEYDTADNLVSETDAAGRSVSYVHDLLNRRTGMSWPGGNEAYEYDGEGNRIRLTDAKDQLFVYEYDALNRLKSRSGPGTQTAYTLDKNGNPEVIAETDSQGTRTTTRHYDQFDRMDSETDVHGVKVGYSYYPNGARKTRVDSDGSVISYGIDGLSRIRTVKQGNATTTYNYDRASRLKAILYPTSSMTQEFDEADRITDISHNANGGEFAHRRYEYDANGNRTLEELTTPQGTQTTTYGYDQADRLTDVVYPEGP